MTIEEKIRAIMKATGWKQQKLAEHFNVAQSTVNRWLAGAEPEGPRRDAINDTYTAYVGTDADTRSAAPLRDAEDIREMLGRIDGLKPENITILLAAIQGFQQANGARSSQAQQDDQSEPASRPRERAPSR